MFVTVQVYICFCWNAAHHEYFVITVCLWMCVCWCVSVTVCLWMCSWHLLVCQIDPLKKAAGYTLLNGKLLIHNPQRAGLYQCIAENKFGAILSKKAQLSFGCKCCLPYLFCSMFKTGWDQFHLAKSNSFWSISILHKIYLINSGKSIPVQLVLAIPFRTL